MSGRDFRWIIPIFGAIVAIISLFTPAITIPNYVPQSSVWMFGLVLDETDTLDISGGYILGGIIMMVFVFIGVFLTILGSLKLRKGEVEGKRVKLFLLIGGLLILASGLLFIMQVITASSLELYIDVIDFGFTVWGLILAGAIVLISIVLTL